MSDASGRCFFDRGRQTELACGPSTFAFAKAIRATYLSSSSRKRKADFWLRVISSSRKQSGQHTVMLFYNKIRGRCTRVH